MSAGALLTQSTFNSDGFGTFVSESGSVTTRRTALKAVLFSPSSRLFIGHRRRPPLRCSVSLSADLDPVDIEGWIEDTAKKLSDFIRFRDNGESGQNLETASVSYGKPLPFSLLQPSLQVDLVSAVHIADKDYFAALQEHLQGYDRVLYEMVADKDPRQTNRNARTRWRPPRRLPGGRIRKFSIIASIQRAMAVLLGLDFQLECMDYRKENWYHADLDYQTFCSLQLARGESVFSVARDVALISLKTMTRFDPRIEHVDSWRAGLLWASRALPMPLIGFFLIEGVCASPDAPLSKSPEVMALLNLDLPAAIKVILAKQLATDLSDDAALVVDNSVIIGERNQVVTRELQEAFRDGCRRIAIFYGGGHMPDLDRRLREEFGLVAKKTQWLTAWSIKKRQRRTNEGFISHLFSCMAKISGWPFDRYQTLSLFLFSWVLALDLWFWEVLFDSLNNWCTDLAIFVSQAQDKMASCGLVIASV